MNDAVNTFPIGSHILGRVLNAKGEPIDKKGPLTNVQHIPILQPSLMNIETDTHEETMPRNQLLETGIKVIDLLAPLPRRGVVGIFGNAGVGRLVVTEELLHSFITRHNCYVVCLSMGESSYEVGELMDLIREGEFEDKVVMLYELMNDSLETRLNMLHAGFTIAGHYNEQGHMTLVVLDKSLTAISEQVPIILRELRQFLKNKQILVILLNTEANSMLVQIGDIPKNLDCQIVLTRKMADQSLWPAVDRLISNSLMLNNRIVGDEHVQVAEKVRDLLRHYVELAVSDQQELPEADKQLFGRALKIQKFFTQPFFVSEAYTDTPGEFVKVEETIKDFKELLEGQYDDLPEQAFYFVGGIDEAIAKSRTS